MVTVVPTMNKGASIVNALSSGLKEGFNHPLVQQGIQRSRLQSALDQSKASMTPEMQQQLGPVMEMLKATGGIPGMDRSLAALLPEVMAQSRADRVLGAPGQQMMGNNPYQMGSQQQNIPENQMQQPIGNSPLGTSASQLNPVEPLGGQQAGLSGVLPRVYSLDDMKNDAMSYAQRMRSPEAYAERFDQLTRENQIAEQKRSNAIKFAQDQGVSAADLPDFMQLGQRHAGIEDLPTWAKETQRDFGEWKRVTEQLDKAFIPGFFTGLVSKENRQKALKNLTDPVQTLVKLGREEQVRSKLANEYLSETEISEQIHPFSKEKQNAMQSLPKGTFPRNQEETIVFEGGRPQSKTTFKSYDDVVSKSPKAVEQQNKNLAKWLKSNLTDDDSLLVLRDKITNDRDYDWRQFADALRMVQSEGKQLSASQNDELSEVYTQAPRDSLSKIFSDWPRFMQYWRGNK